MNVVAFWTTQELHLESRYLMDEDNCPIKLNKDYQWQSPSDVCAGYFDALDNCWQVRHNCFGHLPEVIRDEVQMSE